MQINPSDDIDTEWLDNLRPSADEPPANDARISHLFADFVATSGFDYDNNSLKDREISQLDRSSPNYFDMKELDF